MKNIIVKTVLLTLIATLSTAYARNYDKCSIIELQIVNNTNLEFEITNTEFTTGYLVAADLMGVIDQMTTIEPNSDTTFYAHDEGRHGPSIILQYTAKSNPKLHFKVNFAKSRCDADQIKASKHVQVTSYMKSIEQNGVHRPVYSYVLQNKPGYVDTNSEGKARTVLTLNKCSGDNCENKTEQVDK